MDYKEIGGCILIFGIVIFLVQMIYGNLEYDVFSLWFLKKGIVLVVLKLFW